MGRPRWNGADSKFDAAERVDQENGSGPEGTMNDP